MTEQLTDYDSPWKEVIELYFPRFLEFLRYVTSIERLAKEEGIVENARESIITVLETRFGEVSSSIVEVMNKIEEPSVLKMLHKSAIAIPSTAEFQQVLDSLNSGK